MYRIFEIFYRNKNIPMHLREISRKINLREGPLSRHLKSDILISKKQVNLKLFQINPKYLPMIFLLFDFERFGNLPKIRQIKFYSYYENYLAQFRNKNVNDCDYFQSTKYHNKTENNLGCRICFKVYYICRQSPRCDYSHRLKKRVFI